MKNASTIFYSTVFAAAAVLDSKRKDARRKDWDKRIREAKEDLRTLDEQQQRRLEALSSNADDIGKLIKEGRWFWEDVFDWADRETQHRERLGFKDWKGIRLSVLESLSTYEIEEALRHDMLLLHQDDNSNDYSTSQKGVISMKKLKTLEWSIAKLAYQILQHLSIGKKARDSQSVVSEQLPQDDRRKELDLSKEIQQTNQRLYELSKLSQGRGDFEGFMSPHAPMYSSSSIIDHEKLASLNTSLHNLFQTFRREVENMDSLIAKVCYRLLVSDVPPDVHTYTLLATKFSSLEQYDLVKIILASAAECRVRPNTALMNASLNYYVSVKDIQGFKTLVSQMKGFDGGLILAHPDKRITRATRGRYRFYSRLKRGSPQYIKSSEDCRPRIDMFLEKIHGRNLFPRKVKIIQRSPRNEDVYGALIRGALKLFGDKQGMSYYIKMISEGFQPTLALLTSILQSCCFRKEWKAGSLVWCQIQELAPGPDESAYWWMLRLCQRCKKRGTFLSVLSEGANRGILPGRVYQFRDLIDSLDVDGLIESVTALIRLYQPLGHEKPLSEKRERFEKLLALIGDRMASTARRLGHIELRLRHGPAIGHMHSSKILSLRENNEIRKQDDIQGQMTIYIKNDDFLGRRDNPHISREDRILDDPADVYSKALEAAPALDEGRVPLIPRSPQRRPMVPGMTIPLESDSTSTMTSEMTLG